MKLIVPDNNSSDLTHAIRKLTEKPSEHRITGIYGKPTPNRNIGSGRANMSIELSREATEARAHAFRTLGLEYEYSLNDIIPHSRELKNRAAIIDELRWLEISSIRTVTMANYELMRLAREYCPSVAISVSFFMGIDSVRRLDQILRLPNVRMVNTDRSTYRDLPLLERMAKEAAKHGAGIRIIANLGCMSDCIRTEEHAMIKSMASMDSSGLHYAPCTFYCMRFLLEYPEEFLKLPIIRPEDLAEYEGVGIDSVKLVDRNQTTDWISLVVGRYLEGKTSGNILDLTCNFTTLDIPFLSNEEIAAIDVDLIMRRREKVMEYREMLPMLMGIGISEDFDFLRCRNSCGGCGVCGASDRVHYDLERREIVLAQLDRLTSGYLFK